MTGWCKKTFLSGLGLFIILPLLSSANIITLIKGREITCVVTPDDETIWLDPPDTTEFSKTSSEIGRLGNGWLQSDDDSSSHGFILDKRWEGLKIFDTLEHNHGLSLDEKMIFLSVYARETLTLKVMSEDMSCNMIYTVDKAPVKKWFHVMIRRFKDSIELLSENGFVIDSEKIDCNGPYWIFFESTALFKPHDPEYEWSDTVSNVQEMDYMNISILDNSCIVMYVSIDYNCFLNITLETSTNARTIIKSGFNPKNGPKRWEKIEIEADSPGLAQLHFNRIHSLKNEKYGYWAVGNIGFCSREPEIYHFNIQETEVAEDHRCEILGETHATDDITLLVDTPGYLGNVSCAKILGSPYSYCESYKICLPGSECFCSWGYQGPSCDKTCDKGRYGLFCAKQCTNCTNCHPSNGTCSETKENYENTTLNNTSYDTVVVEKDLGHGQTKFSASLGDYTPEEETLLYDLEKNKDTTLKIIKDREKDEAADGNILHRSSFANKLNPPTPPTSTCVLPHTSTVTTNIMLWTEFIFLILLIITVVVLLVNSCRFRFWKEHQSLPNSPSFANKQIDSFTIPNNIPFSDDQMGSSTARLLQSVKVTVTDD